MVVVYCFVFLYLTFLVLAIVAWLIHLSEKTKASDISVSILITARNEEENLPALFKGLESQDYASSHLEIILVDDQSSDSTFQLLSGYQNTSRFSVCVLQTSLETVTPKKEALNLGIQNSKGDVLLFTDADCAMPKEWVSRMVAQFKNPKIGLTFGPIRYENEGFLEKMLSAEQAALLGSSLATLKIGIPTMCNGANMAVRKSAFEKVNGLETEKVSASGDDELLFHKLFNQDKKSVYFVKDKRAIVSTVAVQDWTALFNQRKRWAGKWEKYLLLRTKLFALFIFSFHVAWLCLGLKLLISAENSSFVWKLIGGKVFLEAVFVVAVMDFLGKKINLLAFCALQVLYSPYVIFFGLVSRNQKFEWKGRVLK